MKAIIKNIEHNTRIVTLVEYSLLDKNGSVVTDEDDQELTRLDPFTAEEIILHEASQKIRRTDFSIKTVILTVNFSEDKFSENYTFQVNVTDPTNETFNEDNLNQRIKEKIDEEIEIYKKRKAYAEIGHPVIKFKIGEEIAGK